MRARCAFGIVGLLLVPRHVPESVERGMATASQGVALMGTAAAEAAVAVPVPEPLQVLTGKIGRRETLGAALRKTLPPAVIHAVVEAARPVHDLARISVGHPFGVTIGPDGLLAAFTYGIDELRTVRVVRRGGSYEADLLERDYEVRPSAVRGLIQSSLFAAVDQAGEEDQLALDLAEIFAWDVDFNTELQRGDSFRVSVEKMYLDGRFSRYGRILAAELVRGDRTVRAVRFQGEESTGYYTPEGRPLRKAFLRSPLRFTRISSGFTHSRFHPILKTSRPHLGVDYAAPVGTPVRASGDGVVTLAGVWGGYGKAVRLRHPNGYETVYGHLSRIDVKRGQRVQQEMILGAVGMTGLATGPHLDYRMLKDGAFINPLKLQSPPAEPVRAAEREAFFAVRDQALAGLEPAPGAPVVAQAAP
jgi:murein DD-endopeptidase MepM/ murein hydrolase activator NlpD